MISANIFTNYNGSSDIIFELYDIIHCVFLCVTINIASPQHTMMMSTYPLKFESRRIDKLSPDIVIKGTWVSIALALILTIPALGLFLGLYQLGVNIAASAGIGFGLHFALLAVSGRISNAISALFED